MLLLFLKARGPGPLSAADFVITLVVSVALFTVFSLVIPHCWSKYASEKILVRTYPLLRLFSCAAYPVLLMLGVYDVIIRRLAGVSRTSDEESQEEKQEEFLSAVE